MDAYLLNSALRLALWGILLLGAGIVGGGLVMGLLRQVTQIDDQSISAFGRLGGLVLTLFLFSQTVSSEIIQFAARLWGGAEFFK